MKSPDIPGRFKLGHAGFAERRDRVWANTTLCDNADDLDLLAGSPQRHVDAVLESSHLVQHAFRAGVLSLSDASLLQQLAAAADEQSAAARRGRAGLTSPAVVEQVARYRPVSARSIRRRMSLLMDRLRCFANSEGIVDDLGQFVDAHEVPPMGLDDVLDEYLWENIEEYLDEFHHEIDDSA